MPGKGCEGGILNRWQYLARLPLYAFWDDKATRDKGVPEAALSVAIRGAEQVDVRRQHHIVELLGEHGGREERDRPQRFFAGIGEVVPHRRGQHEDAAPPDLVLAAGFPAKLAPARHDVFGPL